MVPAIQLKNVSKSFQDFVAVDQLSFQVNPGEITGFLGPNGSGKSTTLRMLMGLIKASAGEITLFGNSLNSHRDEAMKRVGCIIEKPDFYTYLTAHENLSLFARARQVHFSKQEADTLFHRVGLDGRQHDKVKTYSHGMKQRLGLAQVLLHNPDLIILDEPNTGLDPQGIIDLREILVALNKEQGKTILFSSHILSEVQEMCSNLILIHHGKLMAEGKVSDLLSTKTLHVRVEVTNMQQFTSCIEHSEWQKNIQHVDGNEISMMLPKTSISTLVQHLTSNQVELVRIDYRNQLEEYFLTMTNNKTYA